MKCTGKKGFTLVEILIVVIILGILAAIVIPQFTEASNEARVSNLRTNLQTIRSQLLLYKTQHLEKYPTDFVPQMTTYSNAAGETDAAPSSDYPFGPYLQAIPQNPFTGSNTIDVSATLPKTDIGGGWWFSSVTGEFRADLPDTFKTADDTLYNTM